MAEATGTAILHEDTLKELGLSEQPFVDGKKPHRFTDSAMQKTRASLEQHVRFGDPIHLLLGETGAGKTVLLSQLLKLCKSSIKPFVAKGNEGFVAEAFLAAVLAQLGGDECENMTELVEALIPEFATLSEQRLSVLLAIDDAHLAPVEEIAELINVMSEFNSDGETTARLLLTGEAKLKSSLEAIAREYEGMTFDPSISTVAALSEPQMRDYLSSRLNHAGHTDVFPFTEKALTKIHRESAGLPASINTGAAHYLNTVYAAAAGKTGGGLFAALGWPLIALGTAAVGLIAWGLSMFIGGGGDSDQVVQVKPPTIVANAPVEIKLIDDSTDTLTTGNNGQAPLSGDGQVGADLNSALENLAATDIQNNEEVAGDSLLQANGASTSEQAANTGSTLLNTAQNEATIIEPEIASGQAAANLASDQLSQDIDSAGNPITDTDASVSSDSSLADPLSDAVSNASDAASNASNAASDAVSANASSATLAINPGNAGTAGEVAAGDSPSGTTETVVAISGDNSTGNATGNAASNATGDATDNAAGNQLLVAESEKVDIQSLTDSDALSNDRTTDGIAVPLPAVPGSSENESADQRTTPAAPVVSRAVENERWVLFQEPTHFTVQLATSRERNYILELAQGLSESPVAIYPFRTTESQNPVFGLLSGLYKTRSEAISAVDSMPENVKRFGVWIRPISDLQAAIKNNPQ